MGDRGNIVIVQQKRDGQEKADRVWLYTHWAGSELPKILHTALNRGKDRWNDETYLARIIFNEMTKGAEMDTTGYGISTTISDNEHDIIVVDAEQGKVWLESEDGKLIGKAMPIAAFAAKKKPDWKSFS